MEFCLFEGWLCYAMLRRRGGASRRDVYRRRSRAQTPIHTHLCWHLAPHAHARLCGYLRYPSTPRGLPKPRSAYILLPQPESYRYPNLLRMRGTTLTHAICTRPSPTQSIKASGSSFLDSICTHQHAHASTTGASTVGSGAIGSTGSFTKMG